MKKWRAACVVWLAALAGFAGAGAARGQDCRPTPKAELAVTPMGNIPIVAVRINGGTADFLFDTGAERTIISAAAAKRLGVAAHYEYARPMRSLGGAVSGGDARLRSFELGGMAVSNFTILVGPVSLPAVDGKPIEGLLGADFLADYEIDLDLAHHHFPHRASCLGRTRQNPRQRSGGQTSDDKGQQAAH